MLLGRKRMIAGTIALAILVPAKSEVFAQPGESGSGESPTQSGTATASSTSDEDGNQVVIQREAVRLIDPKSYQMSLHLEPARFIRLLAPVAGEVRNIQAKPGDSLNAQTEVIRLENTEQTLMLDRAKANHRAAQIELRRAQSQGDSDLVELAEARLQAAKAELDLAQFSFDRMNIRAPFAGTVYRVLVSEGEPVRAGDPLVELGDATRMKVEIPVDRGQVSEGSSFSLQVEDANVQGRIESLLPLHERFEPLRDLLTSVASAIVIVENANGQLKAGQAVHSPLVPRHPLANIRTSCISNTADGQRKVQVVRQGIVRDLPIQVLGQIGTERIYVSAAFAPEDEIILSTSRELPDGTIVRAAGERPASRRGATGTQPPPNRTPSRPPVDF